MKRFVLLLCLYWHLWDLLPQRLVRSGRGKPVIEGEMPDCYMPIGSDGITLFTNVSVPDGGTMKYQW